MTDAAAFRLATLASGLCQDAGIRLAVHDGPWSWDRHLGTLRIPARTLAEQGPEACAGRLACEVGHHFITRHPLFAAAGPVPIATRVLLDALDDGRAEAWIVARYPGTRTWLDALAAAERPPGPCRPAFLQFCDEVSAEPRRRWRDPPGPLDPDVAAALDATRGARREIAAALPPVDLDAPCPPDLARRYAAEVRPVLLTPSWPPGRPEERVRLHALEALRIAERDVLPAALALLERDLETIERHLSRDPAATACSSLDAILRRIFGSPCERPAGRPCRLATARSLDLLNRALAGAHRPLMPGLPRPPAGRPTPRPGRARPASSPLAMSAATGEYERVLARVERQIDELTARLDAILRPRRRLRERAGYASGRRVDLRRLMTYEADPRRYDELWTRTTIPDRRSVVFGLLVDLSGSMGGAKIESAMLGTVLLAETLSRLDVAFLVDGFQDVLIPICEPGQALDRAARDAIAQMVLEVAGTRPGGNNHPESNDDGPCLTEAALQLFEEPATERVLIVVSDGLPEGRRSNEQDLHDAVGRLSNLKGSLELVALGLGPDTEHVLRFYPEAVASVPVERFALEIGALIERGLTR